ncbi:MAG: flavodoxin family protein [Desulfobacteraceae bacterium]|nr:flavodoxin family protein [Desulfobacteraceae bacterium]MBU4054881.1 flavodoxin family protein [Pseudomonadota bacterium]
METKMEKQKVLVVLGSPRKKGNSASLAEKIIQGAEAAGAITETVFIQGLKIAPCQSCYACQVKDSKGCAIEDDMQSIYPKLLESQSWVLACPVYWFTMSAQMKIFMDRMFALGAYGQNPFHRKRIAIAMSYGDMDPFRSGCVNALRTFQDAFNYTGSKIVGMVYGSANKPGEIESDGALMARAEELGRKLVS